MPCTYYELSQRVSALWCQQLKREFDIFQGMDFESFAALRSLVSSLCSGMSSCALEMPTSVLMRAVKNLHGDSSLSH